MELWSKRLTAPFTPAPAIAAAFITSPVGAGTLLWTSDEPEIFAVAVDSGGALYAASSPDGKVYRIENGKAVEFFAPKAKYIWSLAFAPDGSLFVGTGDPGNVYRVDQAGKSELYYETGQSHVTALAFDSKNNVLVGTEPNGILYRISAKDKAFVLYNASLPEIRTIVPMPDGTVYAAALGGSVANRSRPLLPGIAVSRQHHRHGVGNFHHRFGFGDTRRPAPDLKVQGRRHQTGRAGGRSKYRRP